MTLQLDNPLFDPIAAQYAADMEALADRTLAGDINEREYRDEVERLTVAVILAVFLLGGGSPASPDGTRFLNEQNQIARDSARALAGDVFDGRYSGSTDTEGDEGATAVTGKDSLLSRLTLWTFTLGKVFNRAQVTAVTRPGEAEPSFTWRLGSTEEHCSTCRGLDGQTKTKSEWAALAYLGIEPQGTGLECGGWHCLCRRERVIA